MKKISNNGKCLLNLPFSELLPINDCWVHRNTLVLLKPFTTNHTVLAIL